MEIRYDAQRDIIYLKQGEKVEIVKLEGCSPTVAEFANRVNEQSTWSATINEKGVMVLRPPITKIKVTATAGEGFFE
jgi:hypothetical protein